MINRVAIGLLAALFLVGETGAAPAVDVPRLVAHNDVVYLSPAREGWEGLPLGNGTLGAQVWQPEEGLLFQLNTPLSGVYGGALGRLRVRAARPMFAGMRGYREKLSLGTATVSTEIPSADGMIRWNAFIPADQDALIVQFTDARPGRQASSVELETWRKTAVCRAEAGVLLVTDTLKCQGQPDYRYALAVAADGAPATASTDARIASLSIPAGNFTVWLAVAASRDGGVDVAAEAMAKLAALRKRGMEAARGANADWWTRFWQKSYLFVSSADGVGDYLSNLWYLHIYAMAAGSRGEVPPKFNGGLWTEDYDEREWGSAYWHWNTQETYWPLFAANHLELHKPYQQLYWNMLPAVKEATKNAYGLDGAFFPETVSFEGPAKGTPRDPAGGTNKPTAKSQTGMIFSSSAEIAMQFWWVYLYSGDKAFLRERAYPLMKEVAAFYAGYLEKDAQGRYDMWPSNAHETYLFVRNPVPDLAGIRYLFPALIEAARILNADESLRAVWQDRLDHLAPYPIDPRAGIILPFEPMPGETRPAENGENPELFPIGVFPLITVGSRDQALAVKTFLSRRNCCAYGWTTDAICAARLGLAEEPVPPADGRASSLPRLLVMHAERYQNHPSGLQDYFSRRPAIHPYLEGSGTFATAMNEMLLQSWNGVIQLCPALPKTWSAAFKLLAMGGFEVTGRAVNGRVTEASLFSPGAATVKLVNPFEGLARVTCDNTPVASLSSNASLLVFSTQAGKTYRISSLSAAQPADDNLAGVPPNEAPKNLSVHSANWIGKPPLPSLTLRLTAESNLPQAPAPVPAAARPGRSEFRATRLASAPVIDGNLAEEVWKTAASIGPFLQQASRSTATAPTEVRVGYDDQALYLGITCWESHMNELFAEYPATVHDMNVMLDDSVEVFVQTPQSTTWHFAVNALGSSYEARVAATGQEEPGFDPSWKVAVVCYSNRWTAEIAIPFESMAPHVPTAGSAWGFNVSRNEKPQAEYSTWAPMAAIRRLKLEEFGRIIFPDGPTPVSTKILDPTLVGHWTFDNVKGPWVFDDSGYGNDGMMTAPLKQVPGKVGQALDIAGASVEIPHDPSLNATNALTLALWVFPKEISSGRLIDKARGGGNEDYMLDLYPEGHLRIITSPAVIFAREALPVGQWSHVAVTFGGGALRIYVNGKVTEERMGLTGQLNPSDLSLRLGQESNVRLDDVRIYRRALTAEEIAGLVKLAGE